jgi:hypothetical protein
MASSEDYGKYFCALGSRSIRRVAARVSSADLYAEVRIAMLKELTQAVTCLSLQRIHLSFTGSRGFDTTGVAAGAITRPRSGWCRSPDSTGPGGVSLARTRGFRTTEFPYGTEYCFNPIPRGES